jgi:hypothetical protein
MHFEFIISMKKMKNGRVKKGVVKRWREGESGRETEDS